MEMETGTAIIIILIGLAVVVISFSLGYMICGILSFHSIADEAAYEVAIKQRDSLLGACKSAYAYLQNQTMLTDDEESLFGTLEKAIEEVEE